MGYSNFKERFSAVRIQHNVMAIVGNGFDIQALADLESTTDTRYESFYHYLKYRRFNPNNKILQKMEALRSKEVRTKEPQHWSDIENAIGQLIDEDGTQPERVVEDLSHIQREFSAFLDEVATPDILDRLGDCAVENKLTIISFTEFLGDIKDANEYRKMRLTQRLNIGDLLNFQFINSNYTTLLDDYVYLDQGQFNPRPFKSSDRNTHFHPNPQGHEGAKERQDFSMVSYLVSDVIHPHGIQFIPRSLLFGVDSTEGNGSALAKPYWAQNEVKYVPLFVETDLFIIFGSSLGDTDGWWWRNIAEAISTQEHSELIIYWRVTRGKTGDTDHSVRMKFAKAAGQEGDKTFLHTLDEKVRVVLYFDDTPRAWLNTNPHNVPRWILPSDFRNVTSPTNSA